MQPESAVNPIERWSLVQSSEGVLCVLLGVCALFFLLEKRTRWSLFKFLPPLVFIYLSPVILSNTGVIPTQSQVYDSIRQLVLPMMLVLLLLKVDVVAAVRVMGRGVLVMLSGTLGVVIGAPLGFFCVKQWLGPDGWKAFGTLSGSWIGGTGNLAGVGEMIDVQGTEYGLAVLADTTVYVIWLPILLVSKNFADSFGKFTGVDKDRLKKMDAAAQAIQRGQSAPRFHHYLYLLFIAVAASWLADSLAPRLPEISPLLTASTWRILLVTTIAIGLSATRLKEIPGSHDVAMALVYLFVARMGATAELTAIGGQALPFLLGALVMVFAHGGFCLAAAKLLRVDVHTAAIASAANIGGAASVPVVAAYHKESLVPAGILMAMIGYAVGNYAGWLAAMLCYLVS